MIVDRVLKRKKVESILETTFVSLKFANLIVFTKIVLTTHKPLSTSVFCFPQLSIADLFRIK